MFSIMRTFFQFNLELNLFFKFKILLFRGVNGASDLSNPVDKRVYKVFVCLLFSLSETFISGDIPNLSRFQSGDSDSTILFAAYRVFSRSDSTS